MRRSRSDLINFQNCPKQWNNLFSQQSENPYEALTDMDDSESSVELKKAQPLIQQKSLSSSKLSHMESIRAITPDTLAELSDSFSTTSESSVDVVLNSGTSTPLSGPSWKYSTPTRQGQFTKNCKICKPTRFHTKKRIDVVGDTIFMLDVQCRPVIMIAPVKCVRQVFDLSEGEIEKLFEDTQSFIEKYKLRSGSVEFNFGDWAKYKKHACIKLKLDAVEYVKKFGHLLPKKWWILYQTNLMRQHARVMQWEACERLDYARWLKTNTTHIVSGIRHFHDTKLNKAKNALKKPLPKRPPYIFSIPIACASVFHLQRAVESLKKSSVCVIDPDTKNLKSRFEHIVEQP